MIASGFQNTSTIVSLLVGYAADVEKAQPIATHRYHANLAESGMFSVSTFALDYGNWSLNFKDAVILFIYLVIKCGAGFDGPKASTRKGLELYTNRAAYRLE